MKRRILLLASLVSTTFSLAFYNSFFSRAISELNSDDEISCSNTLTGIDFKSCIYAPEKYAGVFAFPSPKRLILLTLADRAQQKTFYFACTGKKVKMLLLNYGSAGALVRVVKKFLPPEARNHIGWQTQDRYQFKLAFRTANTS